MYEHRLTESKENIANARTLKHTQRRPHRKKTQPRPKHRNQEKTTVETKPIGNHKPYKRTIHTSTKKQQQRTIAKTEQKKTIA